MTKQPSKLGAKGWTLICVALVAPCEGLWLTAKVDTIGTGRPVTACYGETEGIKLGQRFTKEECQAMLAAKLPRYWAEIEPCIRVPTSNNEKAAYTSFAYNVGSAGACRSGAFRKLNAGDHRGACDALMVWNRAQGHVVKGLTNRRAKERALCLAPDTDAPPTRHAAAAVPAACPWWRKC